MNAGDAFDEDGLAGAVVTAQRRHLAGAHLKIGAVQSLHGAEMLRNAVKSEQRLGGLWHRHVSRFRDH
jgi:hypothetical protein